MLLLYCMDASLAMRPLLKRYQSIVLTSGTISPLEMYPKILGMTNVVVTESFSIQMERRCLCPLIVTHGPDQVPVTSRFQLREDPGVIHNYGVFLEQLVQAIPDGMVCFFTSYRYMEQVIEKWYETGVIARILQHKLIFLETKDVVATTYALSLYRQACDSGQGAVFLSVARGKVSEGIDFDRHYGRAVVLFGVPFQYTLSRDLRARLEFLREHYQIKEAEFLNFDAMRQASQCLGRVIRSKKDYGVMIFADQRYARADKRSKIPDWIQAYIEPGHLVMATDTAVNAARSFLLQMSQPYKEVSGAGASVLTPEALQDLQERQAEASLSGLAGTAAPSVGGGRPDADPPGAKRARQM
jgi:DNA excision repair protein ERCC-2